MPGAADRGWAVDTSVAVASIDQHHLSYRLARQAVLSRRPVLAGHAAFETLSVLTRLPGALRLSETEAIDATTAMFGSPCWLSVTQQQAFFVKLRDHGVAGGAIYDALVGEAARVHGRCLLTADVRAARTYGLVGVEIELVPFGDITQP
jgi:hypothetical protein